MTSSLISKLGAAIDNVLIAQSSDTINVKVFGERDKHIENLEAWSRALDEVATKLAEKLATARRERGRDLAAINALIKNTTTEITPVDVSEHATGHMPLSTPLSASPSTPLSTPLSTNGASDPTWTVIQKRKQPTGSRTLKQYTDAAKIRVLPPAHTEIKITTALSLNAISVPTFEQVVADGNLYYVSNADHFAIKIAGRLLHGNIGRIYTDEKNPEKIKDCRHQNKCIKSGKCDYYHDPAKFIGSQDHRNYIASSFLYAPSNSHYKNKARSRRFGSRENLDMDIVSMSEEEIGRFNDQVMHDLLCSLLCTRSC